MTDVLKRPAYFVTMLVSQEVKIRVEADDFDVAEGKAIDYCEENGIDMISILEIKREGYYYG